MRTEHDLDEMLAEHSRRFDPEHRPDLPPAEPRPPRTSWPKNLAVKYWRASDRAELSHWVRKLYVEQEQSAVAVSLALGLDRKVITDEINRQGVKRTPALSTEDRRAMVIAAHESDTEAGPSAIADRLGLNLSTVLNDFRVLGLETQRDRQEAIYRQALAFHDERQGNVTGPEIAEHLGIKVATAQGILRRIRRQAQRPTAADPKVERTVDRALTSMADMAELLQTQPLAGLAPDSEVLDRWENQIRKIVRVVNNVRKHAKGENHGR